ncbi:MAG: nicotinamide riboside transporter PnuC [Alphaproteobacteria bacterium]|nr:nicotinamide riboside transporter PnuC [Alphaproteobacteria bacterium]
MLGGRTIEIVAALLGLVSVSLVVRRSIWNYPFGLVMVALYAWVFFGEKLYSDALLQVFFFVVQIYGWWHWQRRLADDGRVAVARLTPAARTACLALSAGGALAWGSVMSRFTDAAYPFWDGTVAVLSVVAQILLSRRYLENWWFWIVVDVLAVALFVVKGLMPTAALYFVFLLLAVAGLSSWRRSSKVAAE